MNMGMDILTYTDYSPWGLGAFLLIENKITSWFAAGIDEMDEEILGLVVGDPKGQQAGELLAILVAIRLWRHHWTNRPVRLSVKADNVSALTAVLWLKSGATTKLLSQELALEFSASSVRPTAAHIPGAANVLADACSRRFAPGAPGAHWQIPQALLEVPEARPPPRPRAWYECLERGRRHAQGPGEERLRSLYSGPRERTDSSWQ